MSHKTPPAYSITTRSKFRLNQHHQDLWWSKFIPLHLKKKFLPWSLWKKCKLLSILPLYGLTFRVRGKIFGAGTLCRGREASKTHCRVQTSRFYSMWFYSYLKAICPKTHAHSPLIHTQITCFYKAAGCPVGYEEFIQQKLWLCLACVCLLTADGSAGSGTVKGVGWHPVYKWDIY